jgi:hypothetical protein
MMQNRIPTVSKGLIGAVEIQNQFSDWHLPTEEVGVELG